MDTRTFGARCAPYHDHHNSYEYECSVVFTADNFVILKYSYILLAI
jgi:hypothetical protein